MDTDTVYFVPWTHFSNMLNKTLDLYLFANTFYMIEKGDLVAVKIHVGELGNPNYIRPFFIKQIVDLIKERGGKPFLTDTSTYYPVNRTNAYDHMDTAIANGFGFTHFIVADGLNSENIIKVPSPDPLLNEIEIAGVIYEAKAMIVVSHLKGHPLAGFGGAIKNLGMGCVSKKSKLDQHRLIDIMVDRELCTGCAACVEACWFRLPYIKDDKAMIGDNPQCMRCLICSSACPQGAIKLKRREKLGEGLAVAASTVISTFPEKKIAYINFVNDISTYCDCVSFQGEPVGQDVGVFAGFSPLSVDAAGLNRIDYKHLNEIHHTDCFSQIKKMVALNQSGSLEPQIKELL